MTGRNGVPAGIGIHRHSFTAMDRGRYTNAWKGAVLIGACLWLVGGCSSTPYNQVFSKKSTLLNARIYKAPAKRVGAAVTSALLRKGFQIEAADRSNPDIIDATSYYKTGPKSDQTYVITVQADIAPLSAQQTQVTLAGSEKTLLYKKGHTWFHIRLPLLSAIPLFPTGTVHKTETTGTGTITSKQFYRQFFDEVAEQLSAIASAKSPATTSPKSNP